MANEVCTNLEEYRTHQEVSLIKAVNDNKYYLSQNAGKDVGFGYAMRDFI